jgi:hypothetical protein
MPVSDRDKLDHISRVRHKWERGRWRAGAYRLLLQLAPIVVATEHCLEGDLWRGAILSLSPHQRGQPLNACAADADVGGGCERVLTSISCVALPFAVPVFSVGT